MGKVVELMIKDFSGKDFICIIFKFDLVKFKMEIFDSDIVVFLIRRVYDVVGFVRGIVVYFNEKKLFVCLVKGFVLIKLIIANIKRWFLFFFIF